MRFKWLDLLLFAFLFIFVNSFPVDLFNIPYIYQVMIQICLRSLLVAYDFYLLWVYRVNIFKFANYKRMLLFLPLVIICFSNIIAVSIDKGFLALTNDVTLVIVISIYHLLGVIIEEFLFRFVIQNSFVKSSSIKRILFSALIFAGFHLLNMVNATNVDGVVSILIQVAYTFGLGLVLGFLYEYTYSLPACMCFHFLFNFFNTVFIQNIYLVYMSDSTKYLTALVITVVSAVYLLLVYLFVLNRNQKWYKRSIDISIFSKYNFCNGRRHYLSWWTIHQDEL